MFMAARADNERVNTFELHVIRDTTLSMARASEQAGDRETALEHYRLFLKATVDVGTLTDYMGVGAFGPTQEVGEAIQFMKQHDQDYIKRMSANFSDREKQRYDLNPKETEPPIREDRHKEPKYGVDIEQESKSIKACIHSAQLFLSLGKPEAAVVVLETLQGYDKTALDHFVVKNALMAAILRIQADIAIYVSQNGAKVKQIADENIIEQE